MSKVDDKTLQAIGRWMEVLASEGYTVTPAGFWINASKSARKGLLRRLLDGKEPMPAPPPTAFSAPWYELIEAGPEGVTGGMEVTEWACHGSGAMGALVINHCMWAIMEARPNREYLIEFRGRDLSKSTRLPRFLCTYVGPGDMFDVWHLRPAA